MPPAVAPTISTMMSNAGHHEFASFDSGVGLAPVPSTPVVEVVDGSAVGGAVAGGAVVGAGKTMMPPRDVVGVVEVVGDAVAGVVVGALVGASVGGAVAAVVVGAVGASVGGA